MGLFGKKPKIPEAKDFSVDKHHEILTMAERILHDNLKVGRTEEETREACVKMMMALGTALAVIGDTCLITTSEEFGNQMGKFISHAHKLIHEATQRRESTSDVSQPSPEKVSNWTIH